MQHKPYIEERPWGKFIQFTHNEPSTVKILVVNPGEELSLQYHERREEFWHVISGNGKLIIGENELDIVPGKNYLVPRGAQHTIRGGSEGVQVLEIATGDFDEDDIVRLKDKYHRDKKPS